jgi:hypothetical protein
MSVYAIYMLVVLVLEGLKVQERGGAGKFQAAFLMGLVGTFQSKPFLVDSLLKKSKTSERFFFEKYTSLKFSLYYSLEGSPW